MDSEPSCLRVTFELGSVGKASVRQVPNPGTSSDLARLFSPVGAHGGRGRPFPTMRALRGALAQGCPLWVTLPHCPPPPGHAASGPPQPPMGSQICLPRPGPGVLPGSPGLCFSAPPVGARLCRQAGLGGAGALGRHVGQDGMTRVRTWWCHHPQHVHRRPDGPWGGGTGAVRGRAEVA